MEALCPVIKQSRQILLRTEGGDESAAAAADPGRQAVIEALRRGRSEGYEEGLQKGRALGFEAGRVEGVKAGRESGLAEGLAQGKAEGALEGAKAREAELKEQFAAAGRLLQELEAKRGRLLAESETELLKLSLLIAERVVREHLQESDRLREFVKRLLSVVVDKSSIVVRLNEADALALQPLREDLRLSIGAKELNIVADGSLVQGDCIVETNSGNFDARVREQMGEIRRHLPLE